MVCQWEGKKAEGRPPQISKPPRIPEGQRISKKELFEMRKMVSACHEQSNSFFEKDWTPEEFINFLENIYSEVDTLSFWIKTQINYLRIIRGEEPL